MKSETRTLLLSLSRERLRSYTVRTYRAGGGSRPDVLLINVEGTLAVMKDHNASDRGFGKMLGPLLSWREARALRQLKGVTGIPALYARPDKRSLLVEYFAGEPLGNAEHADWCVFFSALEALLRKMHAQGVAHCDLRSPNNVLVRDDGMPAVVDFVSCVFRGSTWNLASRWLFEQFRAADIRALGKLKTHVAAELLTARELRTLNERSRLERVARWIGANIRQLSRRVFTKGAR